MSVLQKDVYLFETLSAENREVMRHFRAICILRPTRENLQLLDAEFKNPKYGEYFIFFTNIISKDYIEELAQADQHEVVHQVQEYFADYFPVNPDLFSLNVDSMVWSGQADFRHKARRTVDGLGALLLSLKKQPYIRACGATSSEICEQLLHQMTQDPGLFDFRKPDVPPLLVLVDRAADPVTPLLSQWTYQAMIHELLGISNNRVDMGEGVSKEREVHEVVLSTEGDPWWRQNMFLNFGDLGVAVKGMVSDYQSKANSNVAIKSLEDIKRFVEEYPEFKKLAGNVTKHVNLMGELNKTITARQLFEVSQVEQSLATRYDPGGHAHQVQELLQNPKVRTFEKLKLVMLFALRYEGDAQVETFIKFLPTCGCSSEDIQAVRTLLSWAGKNKRKVDLYGDSKGFGLKMFSDFTRGLSGVSNIYTEHKPLLHQILDQIGKNILPETAFPFVKGSKTKSAPQDIIIFFVGGCTYEEAATVHAFNSTNTNHRVILGGTHVLNSSSFVDALKDCPIR